VRGGGEPGESREVGFTRDPGDWEEGQKDRESSECVYTEEENGPRKFAGNFLPLGGIY